MESRKFVVTAYILINVMKGRKNQRSINREVQVTLHTLIYALKRRQIDIKTNIEVQKENC